jgi:hypothetical protein
MTGSLGSAEDEGAGGEGRDNKEDMDRVINQLSRAVMTSRGSAPSPGPCPRPGGPRGGRPSGGLAAGGPSGGQGVGQ